MRAGRARPLSPEQRRTAILDAVIPLLIERGTAVTTAEMAVAAGIAEGTIFGVFPDKSALLHAAIATSLDPEPIQIALAEIDPAGQLDAQLTAAAGVLAVRYEKTAALIAMVRSIPHGHEHKEEAHRIAKDSMAAVATALAQLMERYQDQLSVTPEQASILLRGLIFTNAHQLLSGDHHMTPAQLVDVLVNGITIREAG